MLDIAAFVLSRDTHGRIAESLGCRARVRLATTPADLPRIVDDLPPDAVICEFDVTCHEAMVRVVRKLRVDRPRLPIIAYCQVDLRGSRHIMAAAHAGVCALALRGVDDLGATLGTVLQQAEADTVARRVARLFAERVPSAVADVIDVCIREVRNTPTADEVATRLYVPRRTLAYRLHRANAPSISTIVSWSRLFAAVDLLADDRRSVERVALTLGFASGSALRGMLKRYTGLSPRALRGGEGLRCLVEKFVRQLSSTTPSTSLALPAAG